MSMRVIEDRVPQLVWSFANLFDAQTNALMNQNYYAYFMLVDQLENLAIHALNAKNREKLRVVKKIMREYVRYVREQYSKLMQESDFVEKDEERGYRSELDFIEDVVIRYPLMKVIAKTLISALGKTVMDKIIPADAAIYDPFLDLDDVLEEIEMKLRDYGIEPLDVEAVLNAGSGEDRQGESEESV